MKAIGETSLRNEVARPLPMHMYPRKKTAIGSSVTWPIRATPTFARKGLIHAACVAARRQTASNSPALSAITPRMLRRWQASSYEQCLFRAC